MTWDEYKMVTFGGRVVTGEAFRSRGPTQRLQRDSRRPNGSKIEEIDAALIGRGVYADGEVDRARGRQAAAMPRESRGNPTLLKCKTYIPCCPESGRKVPSEM